MVLVHGRSCCDHVAGWMNEKRSSTPSTSGFFFLSSPLPGRLWILASLLSSGYRDSWRSVSAGAGSWLLASDQYFRALLNRHKGNVTFTRIHRFSVLCFRCTNCVWWTRRFVCRLVLSSQLFYGFRRSFVLRVCDKKWQNLLLASICSGNPCFIWSRHLPLHTSSDGSSGNSRRSKWRKMGYNPHQCPQFRVLYW